MQKGHIFFTHACDGGHELKYPHRSLKQHHNLKDTQNEKEFPNEALLQLLVKYTKVTFHFLDDQQSTNSPAYMYRYADTGPIIRSCGSDEEECVVDEDPPTNSNSRLVLVCEEDRQPVLSDLARPRREKKLLNLLLLGELNNTPSSNCNLWFDAIHAFVFFST